MADHVSPIRKLSQQLLFKEEAEAGQTKVPQIMARKTMGGEKLLMKPMKYSVMMYTGERKGTKDEKKRTEVEGIALNKWVAIRGPNKEMGQDGWTVDHIPTGKAIVQDLKNKKLAMVAAKSFIDFIPEEIQKMKNVERMFKMIDKSHAKAFYMYVRDVRVGRTDLPFEAWKKDTAWA